MKITLDQDIKKNDTGMQTIASREAQLEQLRDTVNSYMKRLDVPFRYSAFDQTFYDHCIEDMTKRGWSNSTQAAVRVFLDVGLVIARTAYSHISYPTQIYIAIYTGLVAYVDDVSAKEDIDLLKSFGVTLMEERSHGHEILDALAEILRDIRKYYGDLSGTIIIIATMRFIASTVMEQEMTQPPNSARNLGTRFPRYLRELSGIAETYTMFAFPPSVPYTEYAQVIPDMTTTIDFGNDVLSMYKEELSGDDANQISMVAASERVSKMEVHKQCMEEALKSDESILKLLDGHQDALKAYMSFRAGYIHFHTCLKRYRLRELLGI